MEKGIKVYDIRHGHGKVSKNEDVYKNGYPLLVNFKSGLSITYTLKGKSDVSEKVFLSLTEYDLINGGFTPIDIEIPLKAGIMVYVWDEDDDNILHYGKLLAISGGYYHLENGIWTYASKEIPQWFINKNK